MTAQRTGRTAPATRPDAKTEPIKPREVAKVYKALGLDNAASRRQYLDWSEEGRPEPQYSLHFSAGLSVDSLPAG